MPIASVILIHGYQGVPDDSWKPWFKQQLLERDIAVAMPSMPQPDNPSEEAWIDTIDQLVTNAERPIILVGHSLGGLGILRFLESRATEPVHGTVLIAGVTDLAPYDPREYSFVQSWHNPNDWQQIRAMSKQIVGLYSGDDNDVEPYQGRLLAERAGAALLEVDGYQHFSADDTNPTEVPELLQVVDHLVQLAK